MSKQRYIHTSFWSDPYIETLDTKEKLLFLYFITNELIDLCGIYEISKKKICFETSLSLLELEKTIDKFSKSWKIYYIDGYVYVKNFQKHQKTGSPSIEQWIKRSMDNIPQHIKDMIQGGYTLPPPSPHPPSTLLNLTLLNSTEKFSEVDKNEKELDFEKFWSSYWKKVWDKNKCLTKRMSLKEEERKSIMEFLPWYLKTITDKQYQPFPFTFLNQRRRENDIGDLKSWKDYTDMNNYHNAMQTEEWRNEVLKSLWTELYREMKKKRKQTDLYINM